MLRFLVESLIKELIKDTKSSNLYDILKHAVFTANDNFTCGEMCTAENRLHDAILKHHDVDETMHILEEYGVLEP